MSGTTGTQTEILYSLPASITKNTYTTQAAFTGVLGTNSVCAIPSGFLLNENPNPVGRGLRLFVAGTIANTSAATFFPAFGMDTTAGTIANSATIYAATAPLASQTSVWSCEIIFTCTAFATSTCTWQYNGSWQQSIASAPGAGTAVSTNTAILMFNGSAAGITTTAPIYLELFGTWSVSSSSNTTTVQQMHLFGLN
jgi:hypothetical protein